MMNTSANVLITTPNTPILTPRETFKFMLSFTLQRLYFSTS